MKKVLPGFFILFLFLVLCSCSKKLYTHQQVMQSFHNKDDVFKRFGNPDIKRTVDSTEVWIYNRDISGKTPQPVAKTTPVNDTTQTVAATSRGAYANFVFDHNENVIGYKSNGVDLSYMKKVSAAHNVLNVLGAAAIIIVVVGVEAYTNGDFNF